MEKLLKLIFGVQTAFAQAAGAEKAGSTSFNLFEFILQNLPLWVTAAVIMVFTIILGIVAKKMVENRLASKMENEHQEILIISGRVAFVTVLIIGGTLALAVAGINITTLLAAVGFGISFGLQDTIANFVAGIALLASRPFTIGDWIKVNGATGKVVEIRTRATYLKTFNGERLIVPNSQLYKSQVLSYTSNAMRRIKVPVYCRYGVSMQDVMAICLKEARKHSQVLLEPKPNVVVVDLADSYISLELRIWVDSKSMWRRIESKIFIAIQNRLEEAGFDAPYAVTSLSFEQDAEAVVLKNKQVGPDEFAQLMNERMAEEEKLAKNRGELLKPEPVSVQPTVVDQSGNTFLKTTIIAQQPPTAAELQAAQPQAAPAPEPQAPQPNLQPQPAPEQ